MNVYLGTQGWSYRDWVGPFYPAGTSSRDYLAFYATVFNAVELDATFYGTPRVSSINAWKSATPDDFQFTAKVPRSLTHDRHLVDVKDDLTEFLGAMEALGPKLGPILVQLPPDFTAEELPALRSFLALLPSDLRFAVEFRHRSWLTDSTFDLLRQQKIAWTNIDLSYMPRHIEVTADFTYVRWLGRRSDIQRVHAVQLQRTPELDAWADELDRLSRQTQRVYGFANNHYSGHSPADIRYLKKRLGLTPADENVSPQQGILL